MRIIVPIKQVPETSNVKMDPETGTIVRAGSEAVVNPLDLYAIEAALQLRERHGGLVDVVSMGPKRAEIAIREAIAMGCDGGHLVSDRRFGGSDTWATSYVLSRAIQSLGDYDLIICGERATDGDTAQVGPGIAAWLGLPVATYVAHLEIEAGGPSNGASPNGGGPNGGPSTNSSAEASAAIIAERLIEEGYQRVRVALPAVVTVVKEIAAPRLPTLSGKKRAKTVSVPLLDRDALDVDDAALGLRGSPTKVVRIESPKVMRSGRRVDAREDLDGAVEELARFLADRELIGPLPGEGR